jgi:ferredoxin--NADP+ reductase
MVSFEDATLAERVDITHDLAVFRLAVEKEFAFAPGQFATLALEQNGKLIQRPYTIVSSPHEPLLEFFLELVPHGALSPRLWELKAGDEIKIRSQAAGVFTLDRRSGLSRHLMLATVTGIAPFVSMIRQHAFELERGMGADLSFAVIHTASYAREFGPYLDELQETARDGWLHYAASVSRPVEETSWTGEVGRVEDLIRKYADGLAFDHTNSIAYACGHPTMVENARAILQRARFDRKHIRTEKFFTIPIPR